eukprot:115165_1
MAQPSTEIWKKLTQTQRDELVRDVGLDANGETDDDLTRMITAHHLQKIQLFSTKRAFRKLLESHGWVHQTAQRSILSPQDSIFYAGHPFWRSLWHSSTKKKK